MATPLIRHMADFKVVDKDGEWLVNNCQMAMANGAKNIRYMPGQPIKAKIGEWEQIQIAAGVLSVTTDPFAEPETAAEEKAPEADAEPKPKGKGK